MRDVWRSRETGGAGSGQRSGRTKQSIKLCVLTNFLYGRLAASRVIDSDCACGRHRRRLGGRDRTIERRLDDDCRVGLAHADGKHHGRSIAYRRRLDRGAGHEVVLQARHRPSHDLEDVRSRCPVTGDLVHTRCGHGGLKVDLGGSPVEEGVRRVIIGIWFAKSDRSDL